MSLKLSKMRKSYATDKEDSEQGKWFDLPFGALKLRRFQSKHTEALRKKLEEPHRRGLTSKFSDLPDEVQEEINDRLLAESVIVDWRGEDFMEEGEDGKEIKAPYDSTVMLTALKEMPDLKLEIITLATNMDNYRVAQREDVSKN